jgi:hypothetical protein
MSVIDKHPGPWRTNTWSVGGGTEYVSSISDASGTLLIKEESGDLEFASSELLEFILAAPDTKRERDELLALAKKVIEYDGAPQKWGRPDSLLDEALALVDRIDRNDCASGTVETCTAHAPLVGCFLRVKRRAFGAQREVEHCDCFPVEIQFWDDAKIWAAWDAHMAKHKAGQ